MTSKHTYEVRFQGDKCPFCGSGVPQSEVVDGSQQCPKCEEYFNVEPNAWEPVTFEQLWQGLADFYGNDRSVINRHIDKLDEGEIIGTDVAEYRRAN